MRPAAAILALLLVTPAAFAADPAAPRVVVPTPRHDFGIVPPSEVLEHTFVLRNEGTAPLEIYGVEASCACTATAFDRVVPPGGTGKVTAQVDTRKLKGRTEATLGVRTNDLQNLTVTLTTVVDVRPVLAAFPGYARWSVVRGEKEGSIGQTVWALDGKEFKVLRVEAPAPLSASVRPATEEEKREKVTGAQWRVEATLGPEAPVGPLAGEIEVVTDHPTQPVLRIPVSGFVRPVLHLTPPSGNFGAIDLAKPKRAVFHLQNFATEKIAVLSVETSVPGVEVVLEPEEEGRSYEIELRFAPDMAAGPFRGELKIKTDSAKVPELTIPVSGTIQVAAAQAGNAR